MYTKRVGKVSVGQKKLIAEYFANIGVAWFGGGVITTFLTTPENLQKSLVAIIVGLAFSGLFIFLGFYLMKGAK